jgi:hypothetical protein
MRPMGLMRLMRTIRLMGVMGYVKNRKYPFVLSLLSHGYEKSYLSPRRGALTTDFLPTTDSNGRRRFEQTEEKNDRH